MNKELYEVILNKFGKKLEYLRRVILDTVQARIKGDRNPLL